MYTFFFGNRFGKMKKNVSSLFAYIKIMSTFAGLIIIKKLKIIHCLILWGGVVLSNGMKSNPVNELLHDELAGRIECNTLYRDVIDNTIVEVDHAFPYDYCVELDSSRVRLKAKNEKTATWLIQQYIRYLADTENSIIIHDLPPSIIDFENESSGNFDFVYRDPHFSPNLKHRLQPVNGANTVEEYWDLWGHNLYNELNQYGLINPVFIKGRTQQICFSEQTLFNNVTVYFNKRARALGYDKLRTSRFVIMPLDNMTACDCPQCRRIGNTRTYATPAIIGFLDRLAEMFPDYTFYTGAYHSTKQPPKRMPKSKIDGVLLSSCDLPKGVALDPINAGERDFMQTAREWKKYTDTLFVWDYAANFNDYLTPLPVLYTLKKNLKFYRDCGITGIFLQGSGYDFSPFDDVKTFVATALMIDGRLDVDMLCRRYFAQFYPVSAELLADYYLSLEKTMEQREIPYDLHGSLDNAISSYFDTDDFLDFYQKLGLLLAKEKLDNDEKTRLEKLYTAFSFTWLQIAFHQQTGSYDIANTNEKTVVITPEIETVIKRLSQHNLHHFINYREKDGYLGKYMNYWIRYAEK